MVKNPSLSGEEWNIIANNLSTQGWLINSYNPKNGQRHWKATKWGERHYQKMCKLTGVEKLFGGKTLKQLENANLEFETLGNAHLYDLHLLVNVLDEKTYQDKKELTRKGYEWMYVYTKSKGRRLNGFQARNQIRMQLEAILQMIFLCFYSLSQLRGDKSDDK